MIQVSRIRESRAEDEGFTGLLSGIVFICYDAEAQQTIGMFLLCYTPTGKQLKAPHIRAVSCPRSRVLLVPRIAVRLVWQHALNTLLTEDILHHLGYLK